MARSRASNRVGSSKRVQARRGGRRSPRSSQSPRLRNKVIDSSASEASVRSASSGGESSDDVGLRQVASRLRASGRSQGGGRRASGKRVPAKEVSKLIKFGEGRAYRETAKFDSESESLDDFLVPDDEEEEF